MNNKYQNMGDELKISLSEHPVDKHTVERILLIIKDDYDKLTKTMIDSTDVNQTIRLQGKLQTLANMSKVVSELYLRSEAIRDGRV